jgi:peptidoglycan biosynthesis protein MviN/MurJ (putative lipid II flippase)
MVTIEVINTLAAVVLAGFIVALVYLIVLLHRANRMMARLENLSGTFRSFVADIVPAIVNMGTIATALESVLRALHGKSDNSEPKKTKK